MRASTSSGATSPRLAAPVALGSLGGAYLGAKILMRTSNDRIRMLFIVVLLGLAAKMFLSAIRGGDPAGVP